MSILSFVDLRTAITKSCIARPSENISDKYGFKIDINKLEENLRFTDKNCSLHVLAFNNEIESYIPSYKDIQLVSEYLNRNNGNIDLIFNGKVEICEFMVYAKENIQGSIDINDGAGNTLSDEDLFKYCNDPESLKSDVIYGIIKDLPLYRIIVFRSFDTKYDKYQYRIFIRSNYEMVSFHKTIKEKTKDIKK